MGAGVSSSRRPPVVAVHPATSNQVTSPNPPSLPFKKAKHPRPRQVSFPRIHQNTSRRGRYMRLAVRFDPGGKDARRAFKSAKKWRAAWVEFVTLLEAGARGCAAWSEYETLNRPIGFSGPFTHTSHLIAQLPALSHTFLTQLDAHITLLALMSHQPTHAREAIKREEGVMMLRNMMATLGEMWGAVGKICGEMEGAFGGSDKEGGKDGGREDDWGRDGCVEAKMKILKRVGRVFGKAARRWECVCVEEVKAVGSLREWWRKDWMARMKNSTTDTTPTYLTLLDTWHTLLTSPAALPSRTGVTRATAILSSALTQQHDSERATSQNIALVRKLSRNATAASKKLSRGRVAPADAAVEYSVKGVKERRKLSQDLHALDVAKERLEEGVRRNKELAEGVVCRAVGGLWGSLGSGHHGKRC
ncbi:uncharacterized protein EV422DRAFT_578003 [Fimicolochytrium jonesii]|uniref:uncharacterized protein n=1 Tax=Fimicolochytrium jonesii TaxID=1396493 RepID=UPI0022FF2DB5|nr:uncharacterized protein EV422DRAFT_578003 [Fimicolochytrium jonesii]KAI8821700.1 hypothetical protein EV422DRAFT_578003 [Fimicolochytrium jonesii]